SLPTSEFLPDTSSALLLSIAPCSSTRYFDPAGEGMVASRLLARLSRQCVASASASASTAVAEPFAASFSSHRVRFLISGPPLQFFFLLNQGPIGNWRGE